MYHLIISYSHIAQTHIYLFASINWIINIKCLHVKIDPDVIAIKLF